jgi:membrane fusion protein (multidrug efflux system)
MTLPKHTVWSAVVIAVVFAGVAGIVLHGRKDRQPVAKSPIGGSPIVDVRVVKAQKETLRSVRELAATVEPTRLARLASPAEGPVARLLVREGDLVKNGQLLVVIGRNRTTQARLSSDREELRKVQDEFQRVERLVAKGAVAGELLDKIRADLERAKAMVEAGEEVASDFQVRAPWPGVVSQVLVQEGNYVAPRSVLLEVFDPASLVVRTALPEAVALKVQRGAEARVRFDALPDNAVVGEVTRIFPELDRRLRTRVAEISVDNQKALAPGMFARVLLTVETVPDATVVPATAVVMTPKQEQAFFVVADDVAHLRVGKVGIEDGDRIQVVSGVTAGEMVVVAGHQKLKDGARVRIKTEAAKGQGEQGRAPTDFKGSKVNRP